jgi:hypothetical protein
MSHRTSSGSDFFHQDLEDAEGTLVLHRVPDLDEAESKGRTPPDSAPSLEQTGCRRGHEIEQSES